MVYNMTKKAKSMFKKIGIPVLIIVLAAFIIWLVGQGYGQAQKLPKRVDNVENVIAKTNKKTDSLCNVYQIDKTVLAIQLTEINKQLEEQTIKIDKIYDILLKQNNNHK